MKVLTSLKLGYRIDTRKSQVRSPAHTFGFSFFFFFRLHQSIHPSSSACPVSGRGGSCLSRDTQTSPQPGYFLQLFWEDPKVFPGQLGDIVAPAFPGSSPGSPPSGTCQEHLPRQASRGHPKQMPEPSSLNWLLSMWRRSGSTPSSSRMTELLTLSLRERPATLLISAACIQDLILSVMTQSS